MAKAIHSMVRVLDEDRSVDFYRQALGLQIADRFEFDSFTGLPAQWRGRFRAGAHHQ